MYSLNKWREVEEDNISCKLRLARVYIDIGKTKQADDLLDEVRYYVMLTNSRSIWQKQA